MTTEIPLVRYKCDGCTKIWDTKHQATFCEIQHKCSHNNIGYPWEEKCYYHEDANISLIKRCVHCSKIIRQLDITISYNEEQKLLKEVYEIFEKYNNK